LQELAVFFDLATLTSFYEPLELLVLYKTKESESVTEHERRWLTGNVPSSLLFFSGVPSDLTEPSGAHSQYFGFQLKRLDAFEGLFKL
jgi:hypothetical protein